MRSMTLVVRLALCGAAIILPSCGVEERSYGDLDASTDADTDTDTETDADSGTDTDTDTGTDTSPDTDLSAPGCWTDPASDVTLASSDIVAGCALLDDETLRLYLQFVEAPFSGEASQSINWCLLTTDDSGTDVGCGAGTVGTGPWVYVQMSTSDDIDWEHVWVSVNSILVEDPCAVIGFDFAYNILQVSLPAELIGAPDGFGYIVESAFGDSGGMNEHCPDNSNLYTEDGHFESDAGVIDFGGEPVCE